MPSLGILPQQLAAPADILGPKLWKRWCAVGVVPVGSRRQDRQQTQDRGNKSAQGNEVLGSDWDGKSDRTVMGAILINNGYDEKVNLEII